MTPENVPGEKSSNVMLTFDKIYNLFDLLRSIKVKLLGLNKDVRVSSKRAGLIIVIGEKTHPKHPTTPFIKYWGNFFPPLNLSWENFRTKCLIDENYLKIFKKLLKITATYFAPAILSVWNSSVIMWGLISHIVISLFKSWQTTPCFKSRAMEKTRRHIGFIELVQ